MDRRSWAAAATLLLLSWMAGVSEIDTETCSSPGDFSPPALITNGSSAREGDLVLAHCFVFSRFPVASIFFCKDGVELAKHPVRKGQFSSTLTFQVSPESSGTYSCGYLRLSSHGQVRLSRLSIPWFLDAGGRKDAPRNNSVAPSPELTIEGLGVLGNLAFVVLAFLILALVVHLLLQIGKRVQPARLKALISCQKLTTPCGH